MQGSVKSIMAKKWDTDNPDQEPCLKDVIESWKNNFSK